jgi:ClpP class serine protease
MGEYAGLAAIVAGALVLSIVLYNRAARQKREEFIAGLEKLGAKSYSDLQKDYKNAVRAIERSWRGTVVIDVVHDISESLTGRDKLPVRISYEQAFEIAERIRSAKGHPIAVILHTLGGYAFPSEMIAQALKNFKGRKTAYVPYVAMSGGTAIALATDEIHMGPDAALGPIDAQYHGFPADAYARLIKEKSKDRIDDSTLLISYIVEQREQDARERAFELMNPRHIKDKSDPKKVINALMDESKHHGSRISADAAEKLGIRVARSCPKEVYTLVDSRLRMLKKVEEKAVEEHSLLNQSAAPPAG